MVKHEIRRASSVRRERRGLMEANPLTLRLGGGGEGESIFGGHFCKVQYNRRALVVVEGGGIGGGGS